MRQRTLTAVPALVALLSSPTRAGAQSDDRAWSIELFAGTAWSLGTPLSIRQEGEDPIRFTARYETRPWRDAPYYAYRFARWTGDIGYEAELVHHKLYLRNRPPEIERFEVSHGYNLATLGAAREARRWIVRFGVGVVIAHPEGTIHGRPVEVRGGLGGGYHLAGVTTQLAVGRPIALASRLALVPEGKLTASYTRIPIAGGWARVPNVAVHALTGLRYRLPGR